MSLVDYYEDLLRRAGLAGSPEPKRSVKKRFRRLAQERDASAAAEGLGLRIDESARTAALSSLGSETRPGQGAVDHMAELARERAATLGWRLRHEVHFGAFPTGEFNAIAARAPG